jgi:hypothetical protein
MLPPRKTDLQVSVFTKLSNTFLGKVEYDYASKVDASQGYSALRVLQDKVARLLKHQYLPSRYLVMYAGNHRLVPWNFPFIKGLSFDLVGALRGTQRIDVLYDGDHDCAKAEKSLAQKGLQSTLKGTWLQTLPDNNLWYEVLVQPEHEVWTFGHQVTMLSFHHPAKTIGELDCFSSLCNLCVVCPIVYVDYTSLAKCKTLTTLRLVFAYFSGQTLDGVGKLSNLEHLDVQLHDQYGGHNNKFQEESYYQSNGNTKRVKHVQQEKVCLPSDIQKLTKLKSLAVTGSRLCGEIPKELCCLQRLETIRFQGTSLSGAIPSEVGLLSNLRELILPRNPFLGGKLPKELNNIPSLKTILLGATLAVRIEGVMTNGRWTSDRLWTDT